MRESTLSVRLKESEKNQEEKIEESRGGGGNRKLTIRGVKVSVERAKSEKGVQEEFSSLKGGRDIKKDKTEKEAIGFAPRE